jgi:hypothetical protein
MLITLNKTCVLGTAGQLINVSVYKANELVRLKLASEYIPELERKVIRPETKVISPETKKRGRPPKVKDESN